MSDSIRIESTLENLRGGNFSPDAGPIATVSSGNSVRIETVSPYSPELLTERGVSEDEILSDEITAVEEGEPDGPGPHVVTGPVEIRSAEPRDVLEVEITDIEFRTTYGVNSFDEQSGVLSDDVSELNLEVIRFDPERDVASFKRGITIPLSPFFGIMAVAPPMDVGTVSSVPPARYGGNLDISTFRAGTRIYLPVQTEGALFYVGDGHAAQGDGEVNSTAIETSLTGEFKFRLHKDIPEVSNPIGETPEEYISIGLAETLDEALEQAVKNGVDLLVTQAELSSAQAYRFCSIAVDFRVSQAVNGTVGVHGVIPKSLFADAGTIVPQKFRENIP